MSIRRFRRRERKICLGDFHFQGNVGNLLVDNGRLSAVIDWGGFNVGDPACDLQPAWSLFRGESREKFRNELEVDDASWLRGRGWALAQAVIALPYYWKTNQRMIRQAIEVMNRTCDMA
ncbi:MAG TPA: hypothetical protein EYN91_27550 [Candidatus Melainabacteria bacterium]|nr:hypothetical protein [Candidatus Melainabacteria bacterium]HIN67384.1 hypothetical protein [Candidatus Obscuribacterales bacterium]